MFTIRKSSNLQYTCAAYILRKVKDMMVIYDFKISSHQTGYYMFESAHLCILIHSIAANPALFNG